MSVVTAEVPARELWSLRAIWSRYRGRLGLTYALFCLENLARLAQPLALGWAINDLLRSSWVGLAVFVGQHLTHLLLGTVRQAYDTRTFAAITARLSTELIEAQRARSVSVSRVSARSTLARGYVEFFERELPLLFRSVFSVAGALAFLAWYDPWLVLFCVSLAGPAWVLGRVYARKTLQYSGGLHDELEHEVEVIERGDPREVEGHFRRVGGWRVRLSDWEALHFGLMELFVLGMLSATLLRASATVTAPGDIFAIFRYVMLFLMALDSVPRLVQQGSRLRDIGRRLGPGPGPGG